MNEGRKALNDTGSRWDRRQVGFAFISLHYY